MRKQRKIPSQVLAVLNHAAYTFRSYSAQDYRDLAEECQKRADDMTCVDCGANVPQDIPMPHGLEHRLDSNGRWSCGFRPASGCAKSQHNCLRRMTFQK